MELSILKSTKKLLGVDETYTAFDLDIMTHINTSLSSLSQLGIGPVGGLFIEDDSATWEDLNIPSSWLSMVRTYIFLKTRMLFDPPTTSFLIEAIEKQIEEHEWRMRAFKELPILAEEVI